MSIGVPQSPQLRFALRALLWLIVALAIWWMILLDPMLGALRSVSELVLHALPGGSAAQIRIQPDGNWLLRIPLPASIGNLESTQELFGHNRKDGQLVKIPSVKLLLESKYPALFTVGLPFFWALWAASPYGPNSLQAMLIGSVALAIAAVLSLIFYIFWTTASVLHFSPPGAEGFLLNAGNFLVVEVIPYAGPALLAVGLNRGIQRLVFDGLEAAPQPADIVRKSSRALHPKRGKSSRTIQGERTRNKA